jgi:signal transduction histidine kinase
MTRPASIPAALELLNRLSSAAPPATAAKLEQIIALIQDLSAEAAYFNTQVFENAALLNTPAPRIEVSPPTIEPAPPSTPPLADDSTAFDILVGVNDALRAPLVAIQGRAELLSAGTLGQITEEQAQWLTAIHENAQRAFRLLDSVQQLIAMQRGEVQVDWSHFIASDLLEEAYSRVMNRASARGHELTLAVPESVPLVRGDFYQSLVVLTDLLDNAMRYTSQGGTIRLSVDSLGTHVLFSVADNGIGLRPEDMDSVGKPFWRGDHHPLVRQHPGTGLSLFLARRILALQGGELIFSGEPGVGSTFSFMLTSPAGS